MLASSPNANGIAADARARVAILVRTPLGGQPVQIHAYSTSIGQDVTTFQLAPLGGGAQSFQGSGTITITPQAASADMVYSGVAQDGDFVAVAILTAPDNFSPFQSDPYLHIEALQANSTVATAQLQVYLPPLITLHGIWTSSAAWQPFVDYLVNSAYPSVVVDNFDYSDRSAYSFNDLLTQARLATHVSAALQTCANNGVACSRVDLMGHSMGGLVSRYFADHFSQTDRVNRIVTLATPHYGSPLATLFAQYANRTISAGCPVTGLELAISGYLGTRWQPHR